MSPDTLRDVCVREIAGVDFCVHMHPPPLDYSLSSGERYAGATGGIIPRASFRSHQSMCVWVTSGNVSVTEKVCFNTADIGECSVVPPTGHVERTALPLLPSSHTQSPPFLHRFFLLPQNSLVPLRC